MVDLKTDPTLLQALERSAHQTSTAEEVERQRVSFIKSAVKKTDDVTVSRIREVLAKQQGVAG